MIKTKAKKEKKSRRNKKCISDHLLNEAIRRFLYLPGLNIGFQSTRITTGFQRINIKVISFYMKKPERLKSFRINFLDLGNLSTFKTWAQVMQRHQRYGNSKVITWYSVLLKIWNNIYNLIIWGGNWKISTYKTFHLKQIVNFSVLYTF